MKWQLLALWGIIFMTRYWIVKVLFEPCEYLYFVTTIIHRQNNFLIVHSENDDCGDQYKKASIGLLLFVILWT